MERGINILLIGDPNYAGWAINLAISIKYHSPKVPINLIYQEGLLKHVPSKYFQLFDSSKEISKGDCYDSNGDLQPGLTKINLYPHLRWDENIYLDLDTLLIKPIEPLFNQMRGSYFDTHYIGQGYAKEENFRQMMWAKASQIWERYGLDEKNPMEFINTSFMYIEKCDTTFSLLSLVDFYMQDFYIPIDELAHKWGKNAQPDELYLSIALHIKNFKLSKSQPLYFSQGIVPNIADIRERYYLLCLYGDNNWTSKKLQETYDRCVNKYSLSLLGEPIQYRTEQLMKSKFITKK